MIESGLVVAAAVAATIASRHAPPIEVRPPRLEATIVVDGVLDEPVWVRASQLRNFSSYFPVDGRPATDSTVVLVWYSPTAIHFGVRAFANPSDVRANLSPRDHLDQDDVVSIFLSTFNDGRQAYLFAANPLGVQLDGVLAETGLATGESFLRGIAGGRQTADPSPDFVYHSKGRLTSHGFEVELEIPFKSIRYQAAGEQSWGIHVERTHRATGAVSSWVAARRDAPSYLGQAGVLSGLTDLRRGLVLDVSPVVTSSVEGAPGPDSRWDYRGGRPRFGADVRWGVTTDLTANATVRPDFSQVEADAGQVSFDPRSELFFTEKRPFFLDGSELFDSPGANLIYTRRIVEPVAAAKLAGKLAGTGGGALIAVDDEAQSAGGRNPIFAVARLRRDFGAASRAGLIYTGRFDGADHNQVLGVDGRLGLGGANLNLQVAGSRTRSGAGDRDGALWDAALSIPGRRFAFRYTFKGISDGFETRSGFIGRGAIASARFINQVTFYGAEGGLVERFSIDASPYFTWRYRDLVEGRAAQDHKYHLNGNLRLRGGWGISGSFLYEFQKFDPDLYAGYALLRPTAGGADTIPFIGTRQLHNIDGVFSVTTPQLGGVSGDVQLILGRDVNFFEWARADIVSVTANLHWRPSEQLRFDGSYILQQYRRHRDGSLVGQTRIPRLRLEYQLSRALFVRAIGEYRSEVRDSLRDDSETGWPIAIFDPASGRYVRAGGLENDLLSMDWLVAFQPSPGTVIFAGYGSASGDDHSLAATRLRRIRDGFFVKLSYLFRI